MKCQCTNLIFFCNQDREDGMRLNVMYEDHTVYCDIVVDNRFEGYHDVVHGGMLWYTRCSYVAYHLHGRQKSGIMTRKRLKWNSSSLL